jgi:hypothetical protein
MVFNNWIQFIWWDGKYTHARTHTHQGLDLQLWGPRENQNIVTDLIKALLGNGSVNTFQHKFHATIRWKCFLCGPRHATVWVLCFLHGPWWVYITGVRLQLRLLPCGGGIEYLNRSPASHRRRRKVKSRIWDSKVWSPVPRDSDPRMTALARTSSNCKRETRPLVRESAPHQQTHNCLAIIKIWLWAPDGCFIPRETGRLTVGRNIRLRLRLRLS